jgi:hypothetical protein
MWCRALKFDLDVTLFDRVAAAGVVPTLLDTQYRMHPAISAFPSLHFYGGRLQVWFSHLKRWLRDDRGRACVGDGFQHVSGRQDQGVWACVHWRLDAALPTLILYFA